MRAATRSPLTILVGYGNARAQCSPSSDGQLGKDGERWTLNLLTTQNTLQEQNNENVSFSESSTLSSESCPDLLGPPFSVRRSRSVVLGPSFSVRRSRSAVFGPLFSVRRFRSAPFGPLLYPHPREDQP
jgi:hypothetical protein